MNRIKIYNGNKIFLKANINFESKEITNIESNHDPLLSSIFFNDFSFSRILSFIKSRLNISQVNETNCKLFDDNISIKII